METTTKILAWHNDPALKAEVMERLRKHREADEFVQRLYQRLDPQTASGYRGCAIGCTLPAQSRSTFLDADRGEVKEPNWHREVERLYGIDRRIGWAVDDIFECLLAAECGAFAVDVMDAIPVGADLTDVADWTNEFDFIESDHPQDDAARLIERLRTAPVPTPA